MAQTKQLLVATKKCLKSRNISYASLAKELRISEVSVKRLFSTGKCSLDRLEEICDVLGMTFVDLAKLASDKADLPLILTDEQEGFLVNNPKMLAFFYLLINGWELEEIVKAYQFTAEEAERFLLKLDKIGLIELHPHRRVKRVFSRDVTWKKGGLFSKMYERKVKEEFLNCEFSGKDECFRFVTGELSPATFRVLLKKMTELMQQFNTYAEIDATLPKGDTLGSGLLIALRPWVFSVFSDLERFQTDDSSIEKRGA